MVQRYVLCSNKKNFTLSKFLYIKKNKTTNMASTPLYKFFRNKGTSFFSFPSSSSDFNTYLSQSEIDMHMSKFVLLNIPTSAGKVLNFTKTDIPDSSLGINMYNFDPNSSYPVKYSDKLVESLRNYVANHDAEFRNSKISTNKDFYNPKEYITPTEMIFWKWCKKNNIIDFEPAEHKIDWDKNLSDFDNANASTISNQDYFRKYLWKEREVKNYNCVINTYAGYAELTISQIAKFKIGDKLYVTSGSTAINNIITGSTHTITDIVFDYNIPSTTITLDFSYTDGNTYSGVCYLNYHRLVEYIGDIQYTSKTQAQQENFTEFSAMIPAHAGKTPSILFKINKNSNFYPGLELPILDEQIQDEIIGAENLSSPIRMNPSDYAGSYFGYFDTYDKTYKTSTGDPVRYSGDYYGVLRINNVSLSNDDYVENLEEFWSNNIDGLGLDFDIKHYYKSQQAGKSVTLFDDFNGLSFDGNPPSDFDFNAILWYYTVHNNTTNDSYTNLYGIQFLDNPDNDFGNDGDKTITTTKKLVTNENQDGYSYIYNLNLNFKVDNDMLPLRYDPTSIYNAFSFDLYNNVMSNYVRLTEQYTNIQSEFINMNQEITKLKSLLYSQTDISEIKKRLNNMTDLIKLYQTNQYVDSDTVKIKLDYTKNYPTISFNAQQVDYTEIYNFKTSDIAQYNTAKETQSGSTVSYMITVPESGKFLTNIYNDLVSQYTGLTLNISLDKDLAYKQSCDFIIRPDIALYSNKLNINVMFYDGSPNGKVETLLLGGIDTPVDVSQYNILSPTESVFNNSYYYSLTTFIDRVTTGTTTLVDIKQNLFYIGDYVYVEDFYFESGSTMIDLSGLYYVTGLTGIQLHLNLNTSGFPITLKGTPRIHYYKGFKVSITRIDSNDYSDINHRYLVTKEFLNSELKNPY
jgi:hypothetical protein